MISGVGDVPAKDLQEGRSQATLNNIVFDIYVMTQGKSGVWQWRHGRLTLHLTQSLDTRYLFLMLICCQVSIPFQARPHNAPVNGVWALPGAGQTVQRIDLQQPFKMDAN